MKKVGNKRGVSTVVATVLLILISFLAIGVISAYIIPMIRGGLSQGESCFNARDYIRAADSDDTCYDSEATTLFIERGFNDIEIKGFSISIYSDSLKSSKAFEIKESSSTSGAMMRDELTDDFTALPEIPPRGEGRTYRFSVPNGISAEIGVVLKDGTICQSSSLQVKECQSF